MRQAPMALTYALTESFRIGCLILLIWVGFTHCYSALYAKPLFAHGDSIFRKRFGILYNDLLKKKLFESKVP
jgi:hypothetical protein